MELIADGLLIATAMTAGLYCLVLSRRLKRLTESGGGIGPQIDALDKALGETRAALTETRDGVSELRNSTKAAIAQLARETVRGEDMAERIERGVEEAKATMQRLYEVRDRIEVHENRQPGANSGGDGGPEDGLDGAAGENTGDDAGENALAIEALPVESGDGAVGWAEEGGEPDDDSAEADSSDGPKVTLPEGTVVAPDAASAGAAGSGNERSRSTLKVERVML